MRSKIIINIIVVFLIITSILIITKIKIKDITANESIASEISTEDKIKNSTMLYINSPFYVTNNEQNIIDKDLTLTPIIEDGKVYIPARFISKAYNANIDFSKTKKEITIRLDNKAIVFYNNFNQVKIIDNTSEKTEEIEATPKFINDRIYIPLRSFAQIFEKEVFYYNNLIIISNIENIFDPAEEIYLINDLSNKVKNLPTLQNKNILKNILSNNHENKNTLEQNTTQNVNNSKDIFKTIGEIDFYFNKDTVYGAKNNELYLEISLPNPNNIEYKLNNIFAYEENLILIYSNLVQDIEPSFFVGIYGEKSSRVEKISGILEKVSFNNKMLNIVSYQAIDSDITLENPLTPISSVKDNSRENLSNIVYFPELDGNFYTIITNINILDKSKPIFQKMFFGSGKNILFKNNYVYFITEKDNFNFVHVFKINNNNLEYINRIYFKGKIESLSESLSEEGQEIIKIIVNNNDIKEYLFDYELNKIDIN